jgi:type IV secretory pathway TrbF-like protein
MVRDPTFQDAKRLYLEQYGDPMVTNTCLKITLALPSIVSVALIDLRTIRTFQNFRPLVIRIDDLGRAEANAESARAVGLAFVKTTPRLPTVCLIAKKNLGPTWVQRLPN